LPIRLPAWLQIVALLVLLQGVEQAVKQSGTATTYYDPAGRVTAVVDARGNETDSSYDVANRVTDVYQPAVSINGTTARPHIQTAYDYVGNMHSVTDANGHATVNSYDAVGNKTSVQDGNLHTTSFAYK
jgi:YD repeat-containing protein